MKTNADNKDVKMHQMRNRIRKYFFSLMIVSLMGLCLTGCGCDHEWTEANCTTPKVCSKCNATEGEALGHSWIEANCTEPKTCAVCQAQEGTPLGHTSVEWDLVEANNIDAVVIYEKKCIVCGQTAETKEESMETYVDGDFFCLSPREYIERFKNLYNEKHEFVTEIADVAYFTDAIYVREIVDNKNPDKPMFEIGIETSKTEEKQLGVVYFGEADTWDTTKFMFVQMHFGEYMYAAPVVALLTATLDIDKAGDITFIRSLFSEFANARPIIVADGIACAMSVDTALITTEPFASRSAGRDLTK